MILGCQYFDNSDLPWQTVTIQKTIHAMDEEKPIPKRVYIRTGLTQDRVNEYWKVLGFSRDYWMRQCSPAQRYEQVLDHLLNLEKQNRDNLDSME